MLSCPLGWFWELTLLFPQVVGFVGISKGLVEDGIQPFVDLCSLRFQPSNLVKSQRAVPDRSRLKLLLNGAGMSCSWGSRASKHRPWGVAAQQCELPSSPTCLSKAADETWSRFQPNCSPGVGIPSPSRRINPLLSLWKREQQ